MEAISPGVGHTDSADDRLPAYPVGSARSQEDGAELAAAGGALVTAIVAQRWNEASRTWLQRRIGASPSRQTREEVTVRAGALLGGTLAYLLVTGSDDAPLVLAVFALALISNGIDVAWWSFSRLRHSRSSLPSR